MNIKYLSLRSKNVTCSRRKIWFWLQGTLDRPSKVKPLNKRHAWTCQLLEHFLCLLVCEQRGKVVRFTIFLLGLRFKTKSFGSPWEKINYNGGTLKARRKKAVEGTVVSFLRTMGRMISLVLAVIQLTLLDWVTFIASLLLCESPPLHQTTPCNSFKPSPGRGLYQISLTTGQNFSVFHVHTVYHSRTWAIKLN